MRRLERVYQNGTLAEVDQEELVASFLRTTGQLYRAAIRSFISPAAYGIASMPFEPGKPPIFHNAFGDRTLGVAKKSLICFVRLKSGQPFQQTLP
jgi:hypothetical protein